LDYFPVDCTQNDRIELLIAQHGMVGYGIYIQILRRIYQQEGYWCQWTDRHKVLFAKAVGSTMEMLNEVIETFFNEDLLNRNMYNKHQILTSSEIQTTWREIIARAKRKGCELDDRYNLIDSQNTRPKKTQKNISSQETGKISEQMGISSEEISKSSEEMIQRKEKKKEVKITEEYSFGKAGEKGPPAPVTKKRETTDHWQELVSTWEQFYSGRFQHPPSLQPVDFAALRSIAIRLKKFSIDEKKLEWKKETATRALENFLTRAYTHDWLSKNFCLQNLASKFDIILHNHADHASNSTNIAACSRKRHEAAGLAVIAEIEEDINSMRRGNSNS
jgi:hypothetical protein